MNTLHLLNESPFITHQLDKVLLFANSSDAILLTGNATYALQHNTLPYQTLQHIDLPIYALEEDITTRAIQNSLDNVRIIDYLKFVELSTRYAKVMSWL